MRLRAVGAERHEPVEVRDGLPWPAETLERLGAAPVRLDQGRVQRERVRIVGDRLFVVTREVCVGVGAPEIGVGQRGVELQRRGEVRDRRLGIAGGAVRIATVAVHRCAVVAEADQGVELGDGRVVVAEARVDRRSHAPDVHQRGIDRHGRIEVLQRAGPVAVRQAHAGAVAPQELVVRRALDGRVVVVQGVVQPQARLEVPGARGVHLRQAAAQLDRPSEVLQRVLVVAGEALGVAAPEVAERTVRSQLHDPVEAADRGLQPRGSAALLLRCLHEAEGAVVERPERRLRIRLSPGLMRPCRHAVSESRARSAGS